MLRQLDLDPISGPQPVETGRETIGDVSENLSPVFELNPEDSVG